LVDDSNNEDSQSEQSDTESNSGDDRAQTPSIVVNNGYTPVDLNISVQTESRINNNNNSNTNMGHGQNAPLLNRSESSNASS
jgi:hypothetical protein